MFNNLRRTRRHPGPARFGLGCDPLDKLVMYHQDVGMSVAGSGGPTARSGGPAPGYSSTPLPKKLGIKPGSLVLIVGAPDDFDPGAPFHRRPGAQPYDVVLLFCPDRATLVRKFDGVAARHTAAGMIWVCWPKKSSGVATDLTENQVRDHGLTHGRVDVKVAAITEIWSGLKFVIRLADR